MVVHAISEEARRFYIALGFDPIPAEAMTLVVTLRDLHAALSRQKAVSRRQQAPTPETYVKSITYARIARMQKRTQSNAGQ
jgi:hypothetical protein